MKIEHNSGRPSFNGVKNSRNHIQSALAHLIPIDGKVKLAKVATAYIDSLALFNFIKYIEDHADGRSGAILEIYAQRSSLQSLWNELKPADQLDSDEQKEPQWKRRLRTRFKESGKNLFIRGVQVSIFAVNYQTLFHSKAIYLETNRGHQAIVGSLNLTVNGLIANEELVVNTGHQHQLYGRKDTNRFIKSVGRYISSEAFKKNFGKKGSVTPFICTKHPIVAKTLRDILLDGRLWYERKEIEAFAFPLNLPENIRKAAENLIKVKIPHLKSNLASSISVLDLIDKSFQTDRSENPRWRRKFCIPTCYGLWSPREWCKDIVEIRDERSKERRKRLELTREDFNIGQPNRKIDEACEEIWITLNNGGCPVDQYLKDLTESRSKEWVKRVAKKLNNENYFKILVTGLSDVGAPDVWPGNPIDAEEFEQTFIDSIEIEMNRPRVQSLLAKRLKDLNGDEPVTQKKLRSLMLSEAEFVFGKNDENDHFDESEEES